MKGTVKHLEVGKRNRLTYLVMVLILCCLSCLEEDEYLTSQQIAHQTCFGDFSYRHRYFPPATSDYASLVATQVLFCPTAGACILVPAEVRLMYYADTIVSYPYPDFPHQFDLFYLLEVDLDCRQNDSSIYCDVLMTNTFSTHLYFLGTWDFDYSFRYFHPDNCEIYCPFYDMAQLKGRIWMTILGSNYDDALGRTLAGNYTMDCTSENNFETTDVDYAYQLELEIPVGHRGESGFLVLKLKNP